MPTLDEIYHQINALPQKPYIFWTKKEIRALPKILDKDEKIRGITSGMIDGDTWLIVCTDRRLIFLNHGMFMGVQQVQMPLDRIQSIDHTFMLGLGTIKVYDGLNVTKVGFILQSAILPFVKATEEAMHEYRRTVAQMANPTAKPAAPAATDIATQLSKLADLKEKGHLTEEEFQAQKRKLLSG